MISLHSKNLIYCICRKTYVIVEALITTDLYNVHDYEGREADGYSTVTMHGYIQHFD